MSIDIETRSLIEAAASAAYEYVAETTYKDLPASEMYRRPQCRKVICFMNEALRAAGVEVETVSRGGEVDEHRYLKLGNQIIDATWQQFIPNPGSDDLPKVYIGSREGLQDLVELNGGTPGSVKLWDPYGPGRVLTVQERVAAAYDANL
jgi:hypothetical protein